jgi:hypothetical protein
MLEHPFKGPMPSRTWAKRRIFHKILLKTPAAFTPPPFAMIARNACTLHNPGLFQTKNRKNAKTGQYFSGVHNIT